MTPHRSEPTGTSELPSDVVPASSLTRRRFVEWLGVGVAALGANACTTTPRDEIVPYVHRPPEVTPGVARIYATTATRDGHGVGLLATSREGRPTKVEGHPEHPASLGASGVREQASLFALYDPDRARTFAAGNSPTTWNAFTVAFGPGAGAHAEWMRRRGAGLSLLLEPSASPLRASLLARLRERYPELDVTYLSTSGASTRWAAAKRLFGTVLEPQCRFDAADVVVSLDAELFGAHPMSLAWTRAFADRRRAVRPSGWSHRLYAVETSMTLTGAAAEHRLAVPASEVGAVAASLLAAVAALVDHPAAARFRSKTPDVRHRPFVEALARDLAKNQRRSLVVVGERQPAPVHVLGYALNALLRSEGSTLNVTDAALPGAGTDAYAVERLLGALDGDQVDTLMILGPNPAYTLPGDAEWARRVVRARERVHLSLHENETTHDATWFLPESHFLEHWGDARAYDGTTSLVQPLIEPLHGGKSVDEVLAALAGDASLRGRALLEREWTERGGLGDALRRGVLADSAFPHRSPELDWNAVAEALAQLEPVAARLELDLRLDARLGDGEAANDPWLQELAEPMTKVVWGNAALLGPKTAASFDLEEGDLVALEHGGRRVTLPALVDPGHAEGAVTVWLGHGRRTGRVAANVGTDVASLRALASPWFVRDVTLKKTSARERVVRTQLESSQHDRGVALRATLHEWQATPNFARERDADPISILPDRVSGGVAWGMAVDLNACIGCNACMIACAVENNVPVVGKANVALSREMYWIRLDRYYSGPAEAPKVSFQPMLCQHCEKAPCEYVCPVNATVHSPDGLNEMVYNRCVGTRFCSNNCPYKVRRFNFFDYNQSPSETEKMAKNPDVTVRARGVMEKCTYCVQRIRRAEIDARVAGRRLADADVTTACEQACPAGAIVFGNVADKASRVARAHADERTYAALGEVGTRPRTRYLARIDDPNPELET